MLIIRTTLLSRQTDAEFNLEGKLVPDNLLLPFEMPERNPAAVNRGFDTLFNTIRRRIHPMADFER